MGKSNLNKTYIAIDLKSFYASVECVERGLNPLHTHLVVADPTRTAKTICLAVSPSLKAYGLAGRARLFEVKQRVLAINAKRGQLAQGKLCGASCDERALATDPRLALDYIVAPPRMAHYMQFSTDIYKIYLQYISPEDIHVYSIDEVFIDASDYLQTYNVTPEELTRLLVGEVLERTGITATAGIGSNLYLCKVAMDIWAKRQPPNADGLRLASLDEKSYRRHLWGHRPLTDFWRVGRGYAKRLEAHGLYTMGDVARCSLHNPELLWQIFGVNAELLIDHAWGWEPCTMAEIKAYRPASSSLSAGQVLQRPYEYAEARLIVQEMGEAMALELLSKGLVCSQLMLTIGYDAINLQNGSSSLRKEELHFDRYGRPVPKHAHGTANLPAPTCSARRLAATLLPLFERICNPELLVRRIYLSANNVLPEAEAAAQQAGSQQLELFVDYQQVMAKEAQEQAADAKERQMQQAVLQIKQRFGKNAILRGMSLQEAATARTRNRQIGGHKA